MTATRTAGQSPFLLRLLAYSNERFPLWQVAGQFPMFVAAFLYGQVIVGKDAEFTTSLFAGFVAFVGYTLMFRCFDDCKDAAYDNELYPDRVLQRGLITFTNLKIIALICWVGVGAISIYIDGGLGRVTMWWCILVAATGLFQFIQVKWAFIGAWLESRRVLLVLSVIPFMGIVSVWFAQMGAGEELVSAKVWWLVIAWCSAAVLLEIARKSRTPEDTRATVVDYTKSVTSWTRSLGLTGTVVTLVGFALLATVLEIGMLQAVGAGAWWAYLALIVATLLPVVAAGRFFLRKDRYRAKEVSEMAVALWGIGQIVIACALLAMG